MRLVVIGLLVAVAATACGPPAGRLFRTALPTVDNDPLPVVFGDTTGLVAGIEPAEFDPDAVLEPLVRVDPTEPSAFILRWLGGLCDTEAAISFWHSETTYGLTLVVRGGPGLGGGCPGAGVPRGLRVKTSSPIDVGSIVVYGGG